MERLLRGCRGMARGLGRGFLCGALPALRAGCTWLPGRAGEGASLCPQDPGVLLYSKKEDFSVAF